MPSYSKQLRLLYLRPCELGGSFVFLCDKNIIEVLTDLEAGLIVPEHVGSQFPWL